MNDLRFALRQLLKSPGLTVTVVLSLALGIGASTTVFCWMQNMLLRPLPGIAAQDELVMLHSNQGGGNISGPDAGDFDRLGAVFSGVLVSQVAQASLTVERHTEWVSAQIVSANFFRLVGVTPMLGRAFGSDEDRKPGGNPVLVISERLWRRKFGADPAIVGRVVELNRHRFTIVGVAPASFRGSMTFARYDVWAPVSMIREVTSRAVMNARSERGWHNLARLQPGVNLRQAQAAVDALDAQLARAYPDSNRDVHHRVLWVGQAPSTANVATMLWILLVVSGGMLLIVVANVANLLLARAAGRQKEIAIRVAAGASRAQLVRQLLVESIVLAVPGGIAGALLGSWAIDCIPWFLPGPLASRIVVDFDLDGATMGFTLLLTLGAGVVFGLVPALQGSRIDVIEALNAGGRAMSGAKSHHRWRSALVVIEIGLATALLIGAGLLIQGFRQARRIDLGFNPDRVWVGALQIGMHGYDAESGLAFYRQVQERLAALPGVENAALASWFPLGMQGCKGSGVRVDGYLRPPGEDTTYEYAIVSARYFATLQIPIVAGREFTVADDARAPRVAVINEHFARRFWPGQDALGRRFRCFGEWRTVVGVAKAGKYNRLDEAPQCFYYLPDQQGVPELDLSVCVRLAASHPGHRQRAAGAAVQGFVATLRQAVREIDPGVELVHVFALRDHTATVLVAERMTSSLLTMLGVVSLTLAAMGVYAVMAYSVSQRTQEFGVRMALGADSTDVLRHVAGQGFRLIAGGLAIGIVLAAAVTRLLGSFLYTVSPFDPLTFVGVPLLLAVVAMIACYIPARRATKLNPVEALRAE